MMSNLPAKKFAPPPLPQVYKMAAPVSLPVKKSGLWGRMVTRWEMNFERDYYNSVASIHAAQHAAVKNFNDTMLEALTFGLKYKDTVETFEHQSKMRSLAEQKAEMEVRVLYVECMNGEMDLNMKRKEFEREYGNPKEEDRDD
jgi:hypothetical protein